MSCSWGSASAGQQHRLSRRRREESRKTSRELRWLRSGVVYADFLDRGGGGSMTLFAYRNAFKKPLVRSRLFISLLKMSSPFGRVLVICPRMKRNSRSSRKAYAGVREV